jgi:S-adenosylmethionine:tRNA ribosyltransferase-isomerase
MNDSRVRKARLFAEGHDGRFIEFLLLEQRGPDLWEAIVGPAGRAKPGKTFRFPEGVTGTVLSTEKETRLLRFDPPFDEQWLEKNGHVPLPPYIKRDDTIIDTERYQTVYARSPGSSAAPTAGLHFTWRLLDELRARGVSTAFVTLHVGLGTFLPIRSEEIEAHRMHEERYAIPRETKGSVEHAVAEGRPILAVGTTVVRALESAWTEGGLREGEGATRLFITPGYRFKVVRQIFTNFHTPGSTLLVLVCAFAGTQRIVRAYREAVEKRYRFFSYGDAMLIQ